MTEIGIIGYGELGKQFEHLIRHSFQEVVFYYFDDYSLKAGLKNSYPFKSFLDNAFKDLFFLIGLGYKNLNKKSEVLKYLHEYDRKQFTYIHPTAYIDKTATIKAGSVIYPNVTIDKHVIVGESCVINLSSTIAHDTTIGASSYISPAVIISGFVSIGECVFIGSGCCISNGIEIEDSVIIGIGSVITKNVKVGNVVIGNPQRIIRKITLS